MSLGNAGDPNAEWVGKVLVLGAAFFFANVCFAGLRFVTQLETGLPTGWWVNAVGAVASVALVGWYARNPLPRLNATLNVGLALVTALLLAPAFFGYASSPWWLVILPLASTAVLGWRSSVAWATVAAAGMVFGLVGVAAIRGDALNREPLAEAISSRVVLAYLVMAIGLGVRQLSDRRAARLQEARAVLERTNAHLAEVSEAKNVFLATVSHEIRTPLNGVLGMTSLALEQQMSPKVREYVQMANDSGQALLVIMNDILDFSKIESGALQLERVTFDLHDVLVDALRPFFSQALKKGLKVSCIAAPGVVRTRVGDPTRLRQIISNIVSNAVKFTSQGSIRVRLRAGAQDGDVVIAIADSGVGIPAEKQATIFEPFSQIDGSVTRVYGGTGLGLSIVRQLALAMGGRVELESTVGKGACFTVTVPLPISPEAAPVPRMAGDVLVAGDAEEEVESLAAAFVEGGATVTRTRLEEASPDARFTLALLSTCDAAPSAVLAVARRLSARGMSVVLAVPPVGLGDYASWRECGIGDCRVAPLFAEDVHQLLTSPPTPRLAESEPVTAAAPDPPPPAPRPPSGPRVLMAEDDEMNQVVLSLYLEKMGCAITLAENGAQALDLFSRGRYDLVITDISMPLMDGSELLARMRLHEKRKGHKTPVVALTAHAMHGDTERFLAEGFDACLSKPVSDKLLLETVQRLCPGHAVAPPLT